LESRGRQRRSPTPSAGSTGLSGIGCEVATLSARALKVAGKSFSGFFRQYGTSPQHIDTNSVYRRFLVTT
jgi:hypothetical protein